MLRNKKSLKDFERMSDEKMYDDKVWGDADDDSWSDSDEEMPYILKTKTLRRIADSLDLVSKKKTPTIFSTDGSINLSDIHVFVHEFGTLKFPVTQHDAEKLLKLSSNKRTTGPQLILASDLSVKIDNSSELMNNIKLSLGLDESCELTAKFRNMMIYKRGQSTAIHPDPDKSDNVIATLVIPLPTDFREATLIVKYMLTSKTYTLSADGNDKVIKYTAFHTDCHHQFEKIRRGHLIVLTFYVKLKSGDNNSSLKVEPSLITSIDTFFNESLDDPDVPSTSNKTKDPKPKKLVFLLNYNYPKNEMKWDKLIKEDLRKAGWLLVAANKFKLILALVDVTIKESWFIEDDQDDDLGKFRGIDSNINLFKDLNKKVISNCVPIHSDEIAWNVSNKHNFVPFKNIIVTKNIIQYCYRRTAFVLFPYENGNNELMAWKGTPGLVIHELSLPTNSK